MHEHATCGLNRYIDFVAAAVAATDTCVITTVPVNAYIPLPVRQPSFPDVELALSWDELHGWAVALEATVGDLIVLSYLGQDILPAPTVVARFLDEVLTWTYPGTHEPPPLRVAGDTEELEGRLTKYAR
jgi:hypothetical protein